MRSRFFPLLAAFILFASVATGQTSFEVIGWNVESGGADPAVNAQRISAAQGVEIWGLSEALSSSVHTYTTAAAGGENASFRDLQKIIVPSILSPLMGISSTWSHPPQRTLRC